MQSKMWTSTSIHQPLVEGSLGEWAPQNEAGGFPGSPVVRAPRFHCWGHGFDPWSGNLRSCMLRGMAKKTKTKTNQKQTQKTHIFL